MLTKKQLQLLEFIHARTKVDGVSPSFDEMKEALDLRSKSGIHRLITALEERGFIRRLPHRARAIEIIRMPEPMSSGLTTWGTSYTTCLRVPRRTLPPWWIWRTILLHPSVSLRSVVSSK